MAELCVCLAWLLGFCGASRAITREEWPEYYEQYRPRSVTVVVTAPADDVTTPRRIFTPRSSHVRRDTPQGVTAANKRFTTDLDAFPPIPNYESPQGEKERQQNEKQEKALNRTLNSVCKTC
jgi:hypothetical protein